MKIFAMDTSSVTATVAVLSDEKLLGEYTVSDKLTHSKTILPMADELLKSLSLTINDIDVFAVCVGPGSFTGLRIGMATVKTFSQVTKKPIVGVSSLDAIAYNFDCNGDYIISPIIDSRRDEVYNALYRNGEKILFDRPLHIDKLLNELEDQKVIFAGDGVLLHKERIKSYENSKWHIAPTHLILPSASSVAMCAMKKVKNNEFDDPYTLNPVYLRKSQAERELDEKNKNQEVSGHDSIRQ